MAHLGRILFMAAGLAWAQEPTPKVMPAPPVDKSPMPGMGDLTVAPNRLFFEGRKRSDELLLVNSGARTATYRLSFIYMEMKPDGSLVEQAVKPKDRRLAEDIIRFSPRQVTLEPGTTQTVRVSLRKPADLPEGEYRSHLVMRAVPESEAVDSQPKPEDDGQGLSVKLIPIYGVAVPVVVRHGNTAGTVTWGETRFTQTPTATRLEAWLERQGNQSVYGNLRVLFTPAGGGQTLQVATLNQCAVYDTLDRRGFTFDLVDQARKPLGAGSLLLRFLHPDTERPLAETRLEIR